MSCLNLISRVSFVLLVSLNGLMGVMPRLSEVAGTCRQSHVQSGASTQTLIAGGLTRTYQLYIPSGYNVNKALPLVVSLHGFAGNGRQQEAYSGWQRIAERETFIAVFPEGTGLPERWSAGSSKFIGKPVDDVDFFRALFDSLEKTLCIDDTQLFVNGISNGGGMTNRLACEMAERIAAVGMVAGAYSPIPGGCHPARPIPLIAFHGDADPIVDINGVDSMSLPPVQDWLADWVTRNDCKKGPDPIYAKGDTTGVAYTDCQQNADVQFYTIQGGGHTWPGAISVPLLGKTTTDINASETMWRFFQAHPLPARP